MQNEAISVFVPIVTEITSKLNPRIVQLPKYSIKFTKLIIFIPDTTEKYIFNVRYFVALLFKIALHGISLGFPNCDHRKGFNVLHKSRVSQLPFKKTVVTDTFILYVSPKLGNF